MIDPFDTIPNAEMTFRSTMLLHQLCHENIIHLCKVTPCEKDLYVIVECMDADVHRAIRGNILLDPHRQYIVYQVLKALKFIHSCRVIHGSVKPSNMLLDETCRVVLDCFEKARIVDQVFNIQEEYIYARWYSAPEIVSFHW